MSEGCQLKRVLQEMPKLQLKGEGGGSCVCRVVSSSGYEYVIGDTSNTHGQQELACLRRLLHEFRYPETNKWPGNRAVLTDHILAVFKPPELLGMFPDCVSTEPRRLAKHASGRLMNFLVTRGFAEKLKGGKIKWDKPAIIISYGPTTPVQQPRAAVLSPAASSTVAQSQSLFQN